MCKSQFITYLSSFDDVIFSRPLLLAAVCKHGERLALFSNAVTSGLFFIVFLIHRSSRSSLVHVWYREVCEWSVELYGFSTNKRYGEPFPLSAALNKSWLSPQAATS